MATTLRSRVTFTLLASGATSVATAHNINVHGTSQIPDRVEVDNPNFAVVAVTSTTVQVRNDGSAAATCHVLCEYWHTIDRVFGNGALALTSPPFVPAGGSTGPGGTFWSLTGNAGLDGTQFIGTTDAVDVVFKRSSAEFMRGNAAGLAIPTTKSIEIYNTADEVTNFEKVTLGWSTNIFSVTMTKGGVGTTSRQVRMTTNDGSAIAVSDNAGLSLVGVAAGFFNVAVDVGCQFLTRVITQTTQGFLFQNSPFGSSFSAAAGTQIGVEVLSDVNQSGTAGFKGLRVNTVPTAVGSGTVFGLSVERSSTAVFQIDCKAALSVDGDTVMFLTYFSSGVVKHARVTLGADVAGQRVLQVAT